MLFRAKAPVRVSFAGGGTDVPPFPAQEGGLVLSATINKYAYGTLRPRADRQIRITSADLRMTLEYQADDPMHFDGNLDLVKAAIRNLGGREDGYDLFLRSSAPPGSGLGSSSTLTVALIGLLKAYHRLPVTDYEIADLAYRVERHDLGIKGGLQDQYAATFGGFNFIEFADEHVIVNPLRIGSDTINELEHNMLLCFTGKTRVSDRIIDDQTERYRGGDAKTLEGLRMQKELAVEMKKALLQNRVSEFGSLLGHAWEYKRRMSDHISTPFIDEAYEEACRHGALGGKVTGAGGGGYMLFYCEFERRHEVAEALTRMGVTVGELAFEPHGLATWSVTGD